MSEHELLVNKPDDIAKEDFKNPFNLIGENLSEVISNETKFREKNIKFTTEEIYVGNLDPYLPYEELEEFLTNFGVVENLNYPKADKVIFFLTFKGKKIHDLRFCEIHR